VACDDPRVTSLAAAERARLVSALQAVSPTAPTLCEGWTALDLAAHVVVRERRMDTGPGLLIPALAGWTERVRAGYARRPYPELIELIASGPPLTSPFALPGVDAAANLSEFTIHTEDVLRAQPDWAPGEVDADLQAALWKGLRRGARLMFRRSPVAVVLATPDGQRQAVAGEGPHVTVTGEPLELLLYASGRTGVARVEVSGSDEVVQRFREVRLGF
jgi:uncharacterized protein (TIGR03085 family)